nr:hypothetical protein [Nocardia carnea]
MAEYFAPKAFQSSPIVERCIVPAEVAVETGEHRHHIYRFAWSVEFGGEEMAPIERDGLIEVDLGVGAR